MEEHYSISDYCIIRDQAIMLGEKMIWRSTHDSPSVFLTEAYKQSGISYPKFHKMDNLCKLGFLAAELLLRDKKLEQTYSADETGIILFNASSSMDTDRIHQQTIRDRSAYFPSPSVFVYTLPNIVIGEICIRHKLFGESTFFIEEKFPGQRLFSYVRQLFHDGVIRCCLTGWLELNDNLCDAVLYLVEKMPADEPGIVIFEPVKIHEIYSQKG